MDGVISFWNQGAEAALGYNRAEAVGKVWHRLLESVLPAPLEEIEADLLADGHWEGMVTHRVAGGREVRVSGRWVLVRDANGRPDSVLHLAHDITELSTALDELRALEERQRVILDHSPDAVMLYLPDGTLLHANHIAWEMFDLNDGLLTRGLANLSPDSSAGAVAAATAEQQRTGPVQGEMRMNRRDGTTFLAEYTSAEISGPGGVPTIVTYIRDITQRKQVEEELRASEERHRAVLENSFDAVFLTRGGGELVHVNRAACELFRATAEELMSSSVSTLLEPDTPGLMEFRQERKRTGRARGEMIMVRPDGSRFPAELTSSQFNAADGSVYISTFMRDLTERKKAELALQASERRFRSIFDQAPVGIAQIAGDGRLFDVNPRFCVMLGVTAEQAVGARFDRFVPPEHQAGLGAAFDTALQDPNREVRTVTQEVLRGDGTRVWLQATSAPVRRSDGTLDHILVMLEDVTAKRAAEASAMATLAELERINKMKSEFVSVVSHEFRTALAGIQGFSELIRDENLGKSEMKEFASDINKDALRLNRMITDMLDLDRIEAGRISLRLSNVDLNAAITDTIERARASSSEHSIVADLDPSLPTILADGDRMVQVLSNLLNNAVKYSPAGGEIRVLSRRDGTQVLISVSDQGQGIPQEFLMRVFERYERYESSPASRIIGTGLGLPIARQIVEMHGGKIWVESKVGTGSTFHFTIPVRKL
jgi:PAS domain S-box-containing protein